MYYMKINQQLVKQPGIIIKADEFKSGSIMLRLLDHPHSIIESVPMTIFKTGHLLNIGYIGRDDNIASRAFDECHFYLHRGHRMYDVVQDGETWLCDLIYAGTEVNYNGVDYKEINFRIHPKELLNG